MNQKRVCRQKRSKERYIEKEKKRKNSRRKYTYKRKKSEKKKKNREVDGKIYRKRENCRRIKDISKKKKKKLQAVRVFLYNFFLEKWKILLRVGKDKIFPQKINSVIIYIISRINILFL